MARQGRHSLLPPDPWRVNLPAVNSGPLTWAIFVKNTLAEHKRAYSGVRFQDMPQQEDQAKRDLSQYNENVTSSYGLWDSILRPCHAPTLDKKIAGMCGGAEPGVKRTLRV